MERKENKSDVQDLFEFHKELWERNIKKMSEDWIEWGKDRGYIKETDQEVE